VAKEALIQQAKLDHRLRRFKNNLNSIKEIQIKFS